MANKSNKVKKKVRGWRKTLCNNMLNMKKRRLEKDSVDGNYDKENIPLNEEQLPSNDVINTDETNLHTLQNVVLSLPQENMSSDRTELDRSSLNSPHLDLLHDQNIESDDDTNWYEVSYDDGEEAKSSFSVDGRRIIDVAYFYKRLQEICNHNQAFGCSLNNVHIVSEQRKGLLTKLKLACNMCNKTFYLDSEPKSNLNVNKAITSAIISTGIGYSQFNELCASIDCPSFTQKHYAKIQNETYDDWHKTAISVMEAAAEREKDAAIAEGRVKDGIAYIDVIVDGTWCKRSYNTNFSALSGAAAIIGKRFGEVLFTGVKNKYCCICARAECKNINPVDHTCYKNYSGPSTGMESDILLEGFKQSIPMHNIIYERMVADGDSSTYKKILEGRPYPNCTVEKIECKNHIFRNMCKKLKNITLETKYPSNLRKKITTQRILAIRKAICLSITEHISRDVSFDTKVSNLFTDILNSCNHAFGNHEECQSYYCTSQNTSEDVSLILKTCAIWHRIKFIVNTVAAKARSLIHNSDSNKVESFNNIIAKFVGGKRINFALRRGYGARCNAAVVSFNTKRPLSTLHRKILVNSPGRRLQKFEATILKKRSSENRNKRRKLIFKTKNDKDYGEHCQRPDMGTLEYEKCKEEFLKNLPRSEEDRAKVEKSTILQRDSSTWLELRRKLLTASNFAKVVNRRKNTNVSNLLKNLIYPKNLSHIPSLKHGIDSERIALEQLQTQLNIKIEPCGLFIDKKLPFLGATPDGVVGDDTIIEIKCPITAFKTSLEESIHNKKVNFWRETNSGLLINKKHPWYTQVQGQLHITGRRQCIFGVWSGCNNEIKVEIIQKDDQFWQQVEPKLEHFYMTYMLPELCDPRHVRNMPIRDLCELN